MQQSVQVAEKNIQINKWFIIPPDKWDTTLFSYKDMIKSISNLSNDVNIEYLKSYILTLLDIYDNKKK